MKVSIIVPVYNVAPYLRDCLDSVRIQTCGNWQCICVDDGSTDESGDILNEFQTMDSRFVILHQRNQGVATARNEGLKAATGDWIGFLDGDDILSPFTLEIFHEIVHEHENADVVAFGLKRFDQNSVVKWERTLSVNSEVIDMRTKYPSRPETETAFSGKIYKRRLISENPFPPYHNGEDIVFLFDALLKANYMVATSLQLYGYRQRNNSASKHVIQQRQLLDYYGYSKKIWHMLSKAKKEIDVRIIRRNMIDMTEGMMRMIVLCDITSDQHTYIWNSWTASLREVLQTGKKVGGGQKFRLTIFLLFPHYVMGWFLFYIPIWLKMHGVHR